MRGAGSCVGSGGEARSHLVNIRRSVRSEPVGIRRCRVPASLRAPAGSWLRPGASA